MVKLLLRLVFIFTLLLLVLDLSFAKYCTQDEDCFCGDIISQNMVLDSNKKFDCFDYGFYIKGENIVFDCNGSKLTANRNYANSGLIVKNSFNITIRNCDISRFYNGILINDSEQIFIEDNNLSYNYASGISSHDSDYIYYNGNIINNNFWDGIFLINSSNNFILNNEIRFNEIDGVQVFYGSYNNFIINNDLRYNDGHAIAPLTCDNVIFSNIGGNGKDILYRENMQEIIVEDGNYSEIVFCNVSNSIIRDLRFNNSYMKTDGVLLINSDNVSVINSKFENVRAGIYLFNTSNSKISGNYFSNSDYGIRFMGGSSENLIEENYFFNLKNYFHHESSYNNVFKKNFLKEDYYDFIFDGDFYIYNNGSDIVLDSVEIFNNSGSDYNQYFLIILFLIFFVCLLILFLK